MRCGIARVRESDPKMVPHLVSSRSAGRTNACAKRMYTFNVYQMLKIEGNSAKQQKNTVFQKDTVNLDNTDESNNRTRPASQALGAGSASGPAAAQVRHPFQIALTGARDAAARWALEGFELKVEPSWDRMVLVASVAHFFFLEG